MPIPRSTMKLLVALPLAIVLAVSVAFSGSAQARTIKKVKSEAFGIHSFTTDPQVPTGAIRISCSPLWRQVQPKPGVFRWGPMDASIARAESWGIKDILFVFCGTPKWAGSPVRDPSQEVQGPGATSAPRKMSYWTDFVTAVVKRYKGRIDSYQIWNEITSPQFYQGTPKKMAAMTKSANKVINKYDPKATVVAASVQTHRQNYYDAVAVPYFSALKKKKWPADVISGHFYPFGKVGPDTRMAQIQMFNRTLDRLNLPKSKQRWDTESNFWTGVPGGAPDGRLKGKKAATYLARNYLDTWRTGLTRSYWYMWSNVYVDFGGIQLRQGDAATAAYRTLGGWVTGTKYKGCTTKGRLVKCTFDGAGRPFVIAFTTTGSAKYRFSGKKKVCPVTGADCRKAKRFVKVKTLPLKIG